MRTLRRLFEGELDLRERALFSRKLRISRYTRTYIATLIFFNLCLKRFYLLFFFCFYFDISLSNKNNIGYIQSRNFESIMCFLRIVTYFGFTSFAGSFQFRVSRVPLRRSNGKLTRATGDGSSTDGRAFVFDRVQCEPPRSGIVLDADPAGIASRGQCPRNAQQCPPGKAS